MALSALRGRLRGLAMIWVYEVSIFETERPFPIVVHRFQGLTQAEALSYYQAHLKTDAFLRGCATTHQFGNTPCRTEARWLTQRI
jgi:hypothetical protein